MFEKEHFPFSIVLQVLTQLFVENNFFTAVGAYYLYAALQTNTVKAIMELVQ